MLDSRVWKGDISYRKLLQVAFVSSHSETAVAAGPANMNSLFAPLLVAQPRLNLGIFWNHRELSISAIIYGCSANIKES